MKLFNLQEEALKARPKKRRKVVVLYDITDDKNRRRVSKLLESYGYRIQYSCFYCDLEDKVYKTMVHDIENHIKRHQSDNIMIINIEKNGIINFSNAVIKEDDDEEFMFF